MTLLSIYTCCIAEFGFVFILDVGITDSVTSLLYYCKAALKQTHCIMHYINKGDLTCFDSDQYQAFFTKVLFPLCSRKMALKGHYTKIKSRLCTAYSRNNITYGISHDWLTKVFLFKTMISNLWYQ